MLQEISLAFVNLGLRRDQIKEDEGDAEADEADHLQFPEVFHVLTGHPHELIVDERADVTANQIFGVANTDKHGEASGFDLLGRDLSKHDAHGEHNEAH